MVDDTDTDNNHDADGTIASKKERTGSFFRRRAPASAKSGKVKLPPNWKEVKEEDGSTVYVNSITHRRSVEVPPALPPGWVESLHESGRACYTNKAQRKTIFTFPTAETEAPPDSNSMREEEEGGDEPDSGLFARAMSIVPGRKKAAAGGAVRSSSFGRRKGGASTNASPVNSRRSQSTPAERSGGKAGANPRTVHISCSALIRETKLCVGEEMAAPLDKLLAGLASREIQPELAVKKLMELVGSIIVQQAGLSVMNAQKGVLPHGWLEYIDDNSGRPYYYNVHTRETTWYKPKPPEAPMVIAPPDDGEAVELDTNIDTHRISISADL